MGKITVMGRSPTDPRDGCYFFLYPYIHTDAQRPPLRQPGLDRAAHWAGEVLRVWGEERAFSPVCCEGQPHSWSKVTSAFPNEVQHSVNANGASNEIVQGWHCITLTHAQ